jgi:hypothetical protein
MRESDFPLRIRLDEPPAVMCYLQELVEHGAVRRLKWMTAQNLNQLGRFREAVVIGLLPDRQIAHPIEGYH